MPLDNAALGWLIALEIYDFETWKHSRRVAEIALALAEERGLEKDFRREIWYGALLHDVGKIYIPQKILQKPSSLSNEEWIIMRRHPVYANDMLIQNNVLSTIVDVAFCHHERWDGNGYPRGLKGSEIPVSARVFAVVDVWDALRSKRPYRDAWGISAIRDYISDETGKHFDPKIAERFLTMEPETIDTGVLGNAVWN